MKPSHVRLTLNPKCRKNPLYPLSWAPPFPLCSICGKSCALQEDGVGGLDCVWAAMVVIAGYALWEQHTTLGLCSQDAVQPSFWGEVLPGDSSGQGSQGPAGWLGCHHGLKKRMKGADIPIWPSHTNPLKAQFLQLHLKLSDTSHISPSPKAVYKSSLLEREWDLGAQLDPLHSWCILSTSLHPSCLVRKNGGSSTHSSACEESLN